MNAFTSIAPTAETDDITVFLPGCHGEEYEVRDKLRRLRNVAAALIARTESDTARQLGWMASDYCTAWLYAPASLEHLRDVRRLCHRFLLCAMQVEFIDDEGVDP
jgi:hypothetical protein